MQRIAILTIPETFAVDFGYEQRMDFRYGVWEEAMADVTAHLVSAHSILDELVWQHPQPSLAMGSHDTASQCVCVALVALDECSSLGWSEPGGMGTARSDSPAASWRDHLPQKTALEGPAELEGM
jgi:hypothetical protein